MLNLVSHRLCDFSEKTTKVTQTQPEQNQNETYLGIGVTEFVSRLFAC